MNAPKRLAVIDVGTLKAKFEVREYTAPNQYTVLYKDKQLTVLGRDLPKNNGMLLESSINTTIDALRSFQAIMDDLEVTQYRAVTTEAIRAAKNSKAALEKIYADTRISLEVLSHEKEAHVFFKHVSSTIPDKTIAVADIGGGSVQLIIGKNSYIGYTHLFKTGSYFMQEQFFATHLPTKKELRTAQQYVKAEFNALSKKQHKVDELVYGSSNIINFMEALGIDLFDSGYESPHPYRTSIVDLKQLYDKLVNLSYEDRMPLYPEEPYYMWSADNALLNIFELSKIFRMDTIIPSNENISSGIFSELYATATG